MNLESETIRAFVAIPVPDEVLARISAAQPELKTVLPPYSTAWTKQENMHLTVRFLGNINATAVCELPQQLKTALTGFGAINLICERFTCFPDLRYPRVVAAWVHDTDNRLLGLHRQVDAAVQEFAEKPAEQDFIGHVTLARPKQIKRPDAERLAQFLLATANRQFGEWPAREVRLLRSELSACGAKYHELARVSLA